MYYISTRNHQLRKTLSQAILSGLAEDQGLFVPEYLPKIDINAFTEIDNYPLFAAKVLNEFFLKDELYQSLLAICQTALNFPIPLNQLNKNTYVLELFHGPTLSFKDVGARFLAECLNKIAYQQKITILVATSGDTGSAVASAFYDKSNLNVIILYPKGQISVRQEQQITCWDNNIISLAVRGNFDDCQTLVKSAFTNQWWQQHFLLSSANSINIGRLLPQITYYAYSSMQFYQQYHCVPGYIIPTGNLGNAVAGYYAKLMGFPIREIVLATNENKVIFDYLQTGQYQPRSSIKTLANAMDVGNPSNFERLNDLFNTFSLFKKNVSAISVSDKEILNTIKEIYDEYQKIICPHTATAFFARKKLSSDPWIVVATADASKFEDIIEPLINVKLSVPLALQTLLNKPSVIIEVNNDLCDIQKNIHLQTF